MKDEEGFSVSEFLVHISEKHGAVSAIIFEPPGCRALVTLAHGAGTDMKHDFLRRVAKGFAQAGIATLRFNFPYTEQGKKMPDRAPVATETVSRVLVTARDKYPDIPFFCAGKSFGGRMSSLLLSSNCPDFVKGIVFFGFPLHPPGKPAVDRAQHLTSVPVPMLFLQGTLDTLATKELMDETCGKLTGATLVWFDGYDHSFNRGKQSVIDQLVQRSAHWIDDVLA